MSGISRSFKTRLGRSFFLMIQINPEIAKAATTTKTVKIKDETFDKLNNFFYIHQSPT